MEGVMASHAIEPELNGSLPRRARFRLGTRILRLFLFSFYIGILVLLYWVLTSEISELSRLQQHGKTAVARVTSRRRTHGKSPSQYIGYVFLVAGKPVSGDQSVSEDLYYKTSIGDSLTITYLPSDLTVQCVGMVDAARVKDTQQTAIAVLGVLTIGFVFCIWIIDRVQRRQLNLLRRGVAVTGAIIHYSVPRPGSSMPYYYFTYEFDAPMVGKLRKTVPVSVVVGARLANQSVATVLFDSKKPKNNGLYVALTAVQLKGR